MAYTAFDAPIPFDAAISFDGVQSGHGKTSGVPDIDHAASAAAGIRKWLREQHAKRAAAQAAIDAKHQSLLDRYAETAAQPTTTTLRSSPRTRVNATSPTSVYAAPSPTTIQSTPAHGISSESPVAVIATSVHNVTGTAQTGIRATLNSVFVDIAKIRRQDETLLSAIMAQLMLED